MDPEELQKELDAGKALLQENEDTISQLEAQISEQQASADAYQERFSGVGGAENAEKILTALQEDPKFNDYLNARNNTTPEQSEAIKTVESISNRVMDNKLAEQVNPYLAELSTMHTERMFDKLSDKYPGWESYKDKVAERAGDFPFVDPMKPTFEELDALVVMSGMEVDGGGSVEILINNPIPDPATIQEVPKNLTAEQALNLAAELEGVNF